MNAGEGKMAATQEEAEEEVMQSFSLVEKMVMGVGLVVSLGVVFSPQLALEPGLTAIAVVVASAAAFCWEVYGKPLLRAASIHSE